MALKALPWSGLDEADRMLVDDPLALVIGFVLDQQVTIETAFRGPLKLRDRTGLKPGARLDAKTFAAMTEDEIVELFRQRPAMHMFPAAMGRRVHAVCGIIATRYKNRADNIWLTAADGAELFARVRELPGFGEGKAAIFVGVLGNLLKVAPPGWEAHRMQRPSLADCDTAEALLEYRAWKKNWKAEQRALAEAKVKAKPDAGPRTRAVRAGSAAKSPTAKPAAKSATKSATKPATTPNSATAKSAMAKRPIAKPATPRSSTARSR